MKKIKVEISLSKDDEKFLEDLHGNLSNGVVKAIDSYLRCLTIAWANLFDTFTMEEMDFILEAVIKHDKGNLIPSSNIIDKIDDSDSDTVDRDVVKHKLISLPDERIYYLKIIFHGYKLTNFFTDKHQWN